jgi:hypothetical protein
VVAGDGIPLALDRDQAQVVPAHELEDAVAQEERGPGHAEIVIEVDDAHAVRLALEEGDVVGLEQRREELDEHALVAKSGIVDGGRVLAPRGRRARMHLGSCVCVCGCVCVCVRAARDAVERRQGDEGARDVARDVCRGGRGERGEREAERDERAAHCGAQGGGSDCVLCR